jgi:hypothetical protein
MHEHHRQTVENLQKHFEPDTNNIALIINGSVARGEARPESDVDFYLVVADPLFEELSAKNAAVIEANELCVAPCQEANGFAIPKRTLLEVCDHGNEFMRWAFTRAQVVCSRDAEIQSLVREIPAYPEAERLYRMESYHSQMYYHFSFFEFAYYSQTKYLVYQTATQMLLAAGRLILADNRSLYPGRKWFYRELERTPDKPDGLCQAILDFLDTPTIENGQLILEMIEKHKSYPVPLEGMKARIAKESTLNLEAW